MGNSHLMTLSPFKAAESLLAKFSSFGFCRLLEGHFMGTWAWAHISLQVVSPASSRDDFKFSLIFKS